MMHLASSRFLAPANPHVGAKRCDFEEGKFSVEGKGEESWEKTEAFERGIFPLDSGFPGFYAIEIELGS